MGTSSVAFDAAKAVLYKGALERGTSAGQWWAETVLQVIGGPHVFTRVGLRQMAGGCRATVAQRWVRSRQGQGQLLLMQRWLKYS